MLRTCRILVVSLLCVGAFSGCKTIFTPKQDARGKSLLVATETYRKLIRWGMFEDAAKYIRGKIEPLPAPDLLKMAHYKITAYNAGEQLENEARDEARVVAYIDYYDVDTGIASTIRDEQYWWYDYLGERWYLGTSFPEFGKSKSNKPK